MRTLVLLCQEYFDILKISLSNILKSHLFLDLKLKWIKIGGGIQQKPHLKTILWYGCNQKSISKAIYFPKE